MPKIVLLFFFVCQLTWCNVPFWSKKGHRVVGEIAQDYLSGKAKRAINDLLEGRDLAVASNYSDEIKADTIYRRFSAWHYVNFPAEKKYGEEPPSKHGDLVTGIEECITIIKDENSPRSDKVFYLKMLIHLIGDLHQPMHVGRLEDKGGNDILLKWFNRNSNLHKVWDANMIDDYGMSYTELAHSLPKLSKPEVKRIQQGTIYDWLEETQELTNEVYESVTPEEKLYYGYSYHWWNKVEMQLQKGGLRLAKVLNDLF